MPFLSEPIYVAPTSKSHCKQRNGVVSCCRLRFFHWAASLNATATKLSYVTKTSAKMSFIVRCRSERRRVILSHPSCWLNSICINFPLPRENFLWKQKHFMLSSSWNRARVSPSSASDWKVNSAHGKKGSKKGKGQKGGTSKGISGWCGGGREGKQQAKENSTFLYKKKKRKTLPDLLFSSSSWGCSKSFSFLSSAS